MSALLDDRDEAVATSARRPWRAFAFRRILIGLLIPLAVLDGICAALIAAIHFAPKNAYPALAEVYRLFDNQSENNLPSWYNAALWLVAGLIIAFIARRSASFTKTWWAFAVICVYFSIDETIGFHEHLEILGQSIGNDAGVGLPFAWVIPAAIIAVVIAVVFLRLIWSLPNKARYGILLAGAVFVTGSIGIEEISGFEYAAWGANGLFGLTAMVEETFEMTACALLIASVLSLVQHRSASGELQYRVRAGR